MHAGQQPQVAGLINNALQRCNVLIDWEMKIQSSLVGGGLGVSPDLLEGAEPSVAAHLIAGDLDDAVMSKAKETGRFLYKNLEPQERIDKINSMVSTYFSTVIMA